MCRSEGHVFDGAADQRPCQAPRGLQAHHAHLSGRCRECQSLQAQIPWSDEQQPAWVKICEGPRSRWCNVHVVRLASYGTVWFSFTVIFFFSKSSTYLNVYVYVLTPAGIPLYGQLVKDYPLVLSSEVLSQEVPYHGDAGEMNFYVEGLRFPDKDFDGLISINLSLLEPISAVRSATFLQSAFHLLPCVRYVV